MATPQSQNAGNSLDLVDIKEIKDDVVVVKDGSLRQIVMVGGVNFSLKSDTEQTIITQAYQDFLNGIDFPLQIVVHSRKVNIDQYVQSLLDRKKEESSELLKSQIDEYVEFVKGFVQKNAIMEKVFLVVVSFYSIEGASGISGEASGIVSLLPFFGKKKKATAVASKGAAKNQETTPANDAEREKIFKEHKEQLGQRTTQVANGLLSMGLEATILGKEQLMELFYNFYNPQTIEQKTITPPPMR